MAAGVKRLSDPNYKYLANDSRVIINKEAAPMTAAPVIETTITCCADVSSVTSLAVPFDDVTLKYKIKFNKQCLLNGRFYFRLSRCNGSVIHLQT